MLNYFRNFLEEENQVGKLVVKVIRKITITSDDLNKETAGFLYIFFCAVHVKPEDNIRQDAGRG